MTEVSPRAVDPVAGELRVQDALGRAYRYLGRRDRTIAEVRRHLEAERVQPGAIAAVLAELCQQGYLDDAGYAVRFAEDRRSLDDWGPDRIARRLAQVGVASEHVDAALASRDSEDELAAAVALLRRRFPVAPADDRARDRALSVLVRKGYELELSYAAVRALGRGE